VVGSRQRAWAIVNAPLKATAVREAAPVLLEDGINTGPDMLNAVQQDHQRV
jgi:hypothetical protein